MIAVDFVGGFPRTFEGNTHILIAVDLFSKFVVAVPMPNMTTEVVANLLLYRIGLLFGFPSFLLSDRGTMFRSKVVSQLLLLAESKKINTSSYHPQGDGQAEASVKIITKLLSKLVANHQNTWDSLVPFAVHQYNCSLQDSIRTSPYSVVFGTLPRLFQFCHLLML